jgi:hypothetical protein
MEVANAASVPTRLVAAGTPSIARNVSAAGLASAGPCGPPAAARPEFLRTMPTRPPSISAVMSYLTLLVFTSILLLALRAVAWNQHRQPE